MDDHRQGQDHGALVGWRSQDLGDRIVLRMESVTTPPPHRDEDVRTFLYMVGKQQALQLATELFRLADAEPPRPRRRTFFRR